MALVLIVEDGSEVAGANSYASLAQGDAYHEGRLHSSAWTGADNATKETALVMASRLLDGNVQWLGHRMTITQQLGWPRCGVEWEGHEIPSDTVPQPVRNATIELARLLITTDLQAQQASDNIKSLGLGNGALEIEFKDDSETERVPVAIGELLLGLGGVTSKRGITQRRVVR